jgi:epoxyqueuosine reductase
MRGAATTTRCCATGSQKLAERIAEEVGPFGHRAFTDSAPVLEAELASRSGQGWRGKHTLVLRPRRRLDVLPGRDLRRHGAARARRSPRTAAAAAPASTPARPGHRRAAPARCAALHLVPHDRARRAHPGGAAPAIGNRIYGCDDCQLICPWNKFAKKSPLPDFDARAGLRSRRWPTVRLDRSEFLRRTEGSPIRRIGHERWLRNIAVALGNTVRAGQGEAGAALAARLEHPSALVREHVAWALAQQAAD